MWIKHNNALYNTDYIFKIEVAGTRLKAYFKDGSVEFIGAFKRINESSDIFNSISRALLFEDKDNPGIIIKDTKGSKTQKEEKLSH